VYKEKRRVYDPLLKETRRGIKHSDGNKQQSMSSPNSGSPDPDLSEVYKESSGLIFHQAA
jgi:hypothetical protein